MEKLKTFLGRLYGISRIPEQLPRAAFIRESLIVLGLRGLLLGTAVDALLWFFDLEPAISEHFAQNAGWGTVALILAIACLFFLPYFVLIQRRLRTLRFPAPKVAMWLLVMAALGVIVLPLPTGWWIPNAFFFGVFGSVLVLLAPWADR